PITKHNYLVTNVDDLPYVLAEAFHLAATGRKGPVLVDIPKDVFIAATEVDFPDKVERKGYYIPGEPDREEIEICAKMIEQAERPVIVAGAGVIWSESSEELRKLAEKADIPVVNSLLGLGNFPRNHELSLGMMGMHGEAAATNAVQEADLLMGIGIRYDDRLTGNTTTFAPKAKLVHFDIDPSEFKKTVPSMHTVHGDLRYSLVSLNKIVKKKDHTLWKQQIRQWQEQYPLVVPNDRGLLSRHVVEKLNEVTKGEAIVSTDVGQHQMWTSQFYKFRKPFHWLSSGGLGTMGYGFPAAMGAKFAQPDKEVWAVVGDGGFQMTLQELQTAAEQKLDVKICLLNNGYLGMVRQWQELFYDNRHSHVAMGNPDYGKLADAYGIKFVRCSRVEYLAESFAEARKHEGPTLCEFVVEMEENVYPMVPAGKGNSDLVMDPALQTKAQADPNQPKVKRN
ncbi:MAG: thiamine pyrophosphate-dependent enzyme, partial [Fimbriimonadaceae bacterium]